MRKRSWSWLGALLLGLCLGAGVARADLAADKKKEPGKEAKKGKPGDACKSDADCDQSAQMQACRASKCQIAPPPPPT